MGNRTAPRVAYRITSFFFSCPYVYPIARPIPHDLPLVLSRVPPCILRNPQRSQSSRSTPLCPPLCAPENYTPEWKSVVRSVARARARARRPHLQLDKRNGNYVYGFAGHRARYRYCVLTPILRGTMCGIGAHCLLASSNPTRVAICLNSVWLVRERLGAPNEACRNTRALCRAAAFNRIYDATYRKCRYKRS